MAKARLTGEHVDVSIVELHPGDRVAVKAPGQVGHLYVDDSGNFVLVGFDHNFYAYTRQQWHEYGKVLHVKASTADAG